MKKRARSFDIFSLSFLDVISCGFGAIVLLVLISKFQEVPEPVPETEAARLLSEIFEVEERITSVQETLSRATESNKSNRLLIERLAKMAADTAEQVTHATEAEAGAAERLERLQRLKRALYQAQTAAVQQATSDVRDEEVGGIPVDAEYIVFVVDTSGSMHAIWRRVVAEIENILSIHPKVLGFQVLNDNGDHLMSTYRGRWIPDTPQKRNAIAQLFANWTPMSNSSPVEGIHYALKRYAKDEKIVAIYVFGDDYTGSSYDPIINSLTILNTDRVTREHKARIHAIGFLSPHSTDRFAILMRELSYRNGGSFIALMP